MWRLAVAGAGEPAAGPRPVFPAIPALDTVSVGDTVRFRVDGADTTVVMRWWSNRPDVASIDSLTGLARALATGTAGITGKDIRHSLPNCDLLYYGTLVVR